MDTRRNYGLLLAGAEASHMHSEDDEDYTRGYEWWLMREAKKVSTYYSLLTSSRCPLLQLYHNH